MQEKSCNIFQWKSVISMQKETMSSIIYNTSRTGWQTRKFAYYRLLKLEISLGLQIELDQDWICSLLHWTTWSQILLFMARMRKTSTARGQNHQDFLKSEMNSCFGAQETSVPTGNAVQLICSYLIRKPILFHKMANLFPRKQDMIITTAN